ncbi:hypothetical protein [Pseudobacteriovorax antillogorgiicola]|uniref:Uncharacterized protein n=1 Tax=Pseudobacteriovorax antillogorgiicola TaxID=1513793 RepID=A0A1Y6C5A8_9BACT|nr:hypothetical protein [Pseudobacteriovorax antillogorgiicola]TCS51172.1 hypothetical protein EDD56_11155 [Pseudobacteriovorax antillogorgiicola]SMF38027.1 hypothetical protein SAMN06296036_111123 [Pseudobacteriovorax antillogorgiicola]
MRYLRTHIFLCIIAILGIRCGGKGGSGGSGAPSYGPIETSLRITASNNNIPYRLLLAVALKESNLSPQPATTLYNADSVLGMSVGETAFGLSFETLELSVVPENMTLEPQIEAYGRWLRKALDQKQLGLDETVANPDELYDWVWQMAQLHRNGQENRKNVQIVFALEMIDMLNRGATWQDLESGEIITLLPEPNPIAVDRAFSSQIQKNLQLDTQKSEIFSVDYMQLTYSQTVDQQNLPENIRVIHCPFTLSACLEIQHRETEKPEARLQAHYVIPPDQSIVPNPLKIQQHRVPVLLTDTRGQTESIQNAVVIMLVGDSGRYVEGVRQKSNPQWVSNYQLQTLGKIVPGICDLMKQDNPNVNASSCRTPGIPGGVQFQNQGPSETYRWGDIPDYDKNIFWTYVIDQDQLGGIAEFNFVQANRIYQAGSPINFNLKFIRGATKVSLEYMERCENNKVVWTTLQTHFIRDTDDLSIQTMLYARGPNGNGQHFLRALVYGESGKLQGWKVEELFLQNYDENNIVFADLDQCT